MGNIDKVVDSQSLNFWCGSLGWQGGTIHQVKEYLKDKYKEYGFITDKESKRIAKLMKIKQRPRNGREILHVGIRGTKTIILGKDFYSNYYIATI